METERTHPRGEAIRQFLRRGVVPEVSRAAGKIICISSVHEIIPWAGHANYAASKGGVSMLMKTIAQEAGSNPSGAVRCVYLYLP